MLSPAPMPFKTNRSAGPATRLGGFTLLGFSGPDAAAFLQAQTMNDVRLLDVLRWQWNGWLNPKGRLICLFALLRTAEAEFIAVLADFPAADLQAQLQRFVFRSKVKLEPVTSHVAAAHFDAVPDMGHSASDLAEGSAETGFRLDFSGEGCRRELMLLPASSQALRPQDDDCDARWLSCDLAHGLPRIAAAQREAWTPQMLSLDRLNAFSVKKGCYPGQEIVARTHFLGKAKRLLARVEGRGLDPGASVQDGNGHAIGSVACVNVDGSAGLAIMQAGEHPSGVLVGGNTVALPPLLGGLQRPV